MIQSEIILTQINKNVTEFKDVFKTLFVTAESPLKEYIQRKKLLEDFDEFYNLLAVQLDEVKNTLNSVIKVHYAQTQSILKCIGNADNSAQPPEDSPVTASRGAQPPTPKRSKKVNATAFTYPAIIKQQHLLDQAPFLKYIEDIPIQNSTAVITNSLNKVPMTIPAVRIDKVSDAPSGQLSYCAASNEFVLKLHQITLRGNIGNIYRDNIDLERIKPCSYQQNCVDRRRCKFWHDPAKTTSNEIVNFTTKSWIYHPGCHGKRQFGSADTLEYDMLSMNEIDTFIFIKQAMHDFLCAIILYNHIEQKKAL